MYNFRINCSTGTGGRSASPRSSHRTEMSENFAPDSDQDPSGLIDLFVDNANDPADPLPPFRFEHDRAPTVPNNSQRATESQEIATATRVASSELRFTSFDGTVGGLGARKRRSGGRRESVVKRECFEEVTDDNGDVVGSRCLFCGECVSDKQRSASRLADHTANCAETPADLRQEVYKDSAHLKNKRLKGELFSKRIDILRNEASQSNCLSISATSPASKQRWSQRRTRIPRVDQCDAEEREKLSTALVEALIELGIPFTVLEARRGKLNKLLKFIKMLRPGYFDQGFITRQTASTRYLDKIYDDLHGAISSRIEACLKHSYGTVVFDGWEDVNGESVVNVLLRLEDRSMGNRNTVFLRCIYTGDQKVTAEEYIRIIESVMADHGGMARISGVTSDSAQCCVKARNELMRKYPGLIGVQDQSHVANLLMEDIGKLPWVKGVTDQVSQLTSEAKSRRKLMSRLRVEIKKYNSQVEFPGDRTPNLGLVGEFSLSAEALFPPVKPTAIMLCKPAPTRFASIQNTLEAFLRTRAVLRTIIDLPEFHTTLYEAATLEQRMKRSNRFERPIDSKPFYGKVLALNNVFRLCRRYLRAFDSDKGSLADVVPLTEHLERSLERLPICEFLTEERKAQILEVFKRRKSGTSSVLGANIKVNLICSVHVAAYILHPGKCPIDCTKYLLELQAEAEKYLKSALPASHNNPSSEHGIDSQQVQQAVSESAVGLVSNFIQLQQKWMALRGNPRTLSNFTFMKLLPLVYWSQIKEEGEHEILADFAMRVLSVSPSSRSAERSFSIQKHVRSKSRNRLGKDKVAKIMFCHWNLKLFEGTSQFSIPFELSALPKEDLQGVDEMETFAH